jgi:hypothetical protein
MKEYNKYCINIIDLCLKIDSILEIIHTNQFKLISITSTTDGKKGFNLSITYLEKL